MCSGTARPGSDVDVAILFEDLPTPALLDRLTEDLGAAAERRVDLVVLNAAPPCWRARSSRAGALSCAVTRTSACGLRPARRLATRIRPTFAECSTPTCENGPSRTVPVRAEVVRKKLLDIGESLGPAPLLAPGDGGAVRNRSHAAVGRRARAAEALFDVGSHILAGEFHESVDEYRDPGRLRARAVLSEETARRLDGLAGFRNVLVHEYADVDPRRFHAGLDRTTLAGGRSCAETG